MDNLEHLEKEMADQLRSQIRLIPDFPKKGILFRDITPLLKHRDTLELTSRVLAHPFRGERIDYVVGLESRGFLFGTNLAQDLHAGFIPVRKPNKLPYSKIVESYDLEYGTDNLEMHDDAIHVGSRVLIHDDLLATGGSAAAATRLVKRMGGVVVGYSFIIQIDALNGEDLLEPNVPIHVILHE